MQKWYESVTENVHKLFGIDYAYVIFFQITFNLAFKKYSKFFNT